MIAVELTREAVWPDAGWEGLAQRAAELAISKSPYIALCRATSTIEISIHLTDDTRVRSLNTQYRHKDKPTNVLSFPMIEPDLLDLVATVEEGEVLLGDIVLAHGICVAEAEERGISIVDHATHLIVHGTLHLLGYDHMGDAEAETMEALETDVLAALGLADPYLIRED
ncbi:MAG: rRNA maturation RNase YbeY [Sphingomonas sp.]